MKTLNPYSPPAIPEQEVAISRPLTADRSFWAILLTQFLGAFNDNVYKQTLLLLFVAVPVGVDAAGRPMTKDFQGAGSLVFALPFLLFSGIAGYLADRYPKTRVIWLCKVAEVVIMLVGLSLFVIYDRIGMSATMVALFLIALFLMGSHSAFFGPPKYGVLPELFAERDLPKANGMILMTTFLAVIFGNVLAGALKEAFPGQLSVIGATCIGIAILGVGTSLLFRQLEAVQPDLLFRWDFVGVPREMRALLREDGTLFAALLVSSIFWMIGAMAMTAVNSLGKIQLGASDKETSLLLATLSIGIVGGSATAGVLSNGRFHTGVLKTGAWGLFLSLLALALPGNDHGHLLGYRGSMICLLVAGLSTGMLAVPLQVLMQMRPPKNLKGQMIAAMNLWNWSGIVAGGALYQVITLVLEHWQLPPCNAFWILAATMGCVAIFYRPRDEASFAGTAVTP